MSAKRHKRIPAVEEDQAPYGSNGAAVLPRRLRFIDLFCGIGGFRLAFERAGCECVFSSDWDKHAQSKRATPTSYLVGGAREKSGD